MNDDELVDALKAVAHPLRLKILQSLSGTERNVGDIDAVAAIGQPALSQQLAVLRAAGLVLTRKEAKQVFYRLDEGRMAIVAEAVGDLARKPKPAKAASRRAPASVARFARLG